jgi:hypothetical protein
MTLWPPPLPKDQFVGSNFGLNIDCLKFNGDIYIYDIWNT